jgi:hypothetical protein
MDGNCIYKEREYIGNTCPAFTNRHYAPPPLSDEEIELAKLCQQFCNACPPKVVSKYGEGKLHNKPFNYFIYYDICTTERDIGLAYPWNRIRLEELFAELWAVRDELRTEIEKANNGK